MRWVTAHGKELLVDEKIVEVTRQRAEGFAESITGRAVHELLFQPAPGNVFPLFPALLAARAVVMSGRLAWVDSTGSFYPPAAIASGISPQQMYVLRPRPADVVWATIESLRCRSIKAVVALMMQPLTQRPVTKPPGTRTGARAGITPHYVELAPEVARLLDRDQLTREQAAGKLGIHQSTVDRAYAHHHRDRLQAAARQGAQITRRPPRRIGKEKVDRILALSAEGLAPGAIARAVPCGENTVYRVLKDPRCNRDQAA